MRSTLIIAGLLLVVGLLLAPGLYAEQAATTSDRPAVHTPQTRPADVAAKGAPSIEAPVFTLNDQNGKPVSLSDHAGHVVVLEWINPACPYVQRHYKEKTMQSLADKYQGKGVVWLAINSTAGADAKVNKAWADKYDLPYPILDDHAGKVAGLYSARTTPHMFVIDRTGKLVYKGAIDDSPQGDKAGAVNYVDVVLQKLTSGQSVTLQETKPYGCSVKYAKS